MAETEPRRTQQVREVVEDRPEDEEQSTVISWLRTRRPALEKGDQMSERLRAQPRLQLSCLSHILLTSVNTLHQQI